MPRIDLMGSKLELPDGWRGVSFVFIAPETEREKAAIPLLAAPIGFRETVMVSVEPVAKGTTPNAYHEAQLQQLRASGQNASAASKQEREHAGVPALLVELQMQGPRGERLRQLQLIVVKSGEAWAAMATTLDGAGYPAAKTRLLKVLESLSL